MAQADHRCHRPAHVDKALDAVVHLRQRDDGDHLDQLYNWRDRDRINLALQLKGKHRVQRIALKGARS